MRKPNKLEREHMARVADMGCVLCGGLAEIHHILEGRHSQRKASHFDVLPLCYMHHRGGGSGVAIHAGIKSWNKNYGSEWDLLEKIKGELE